MQELGHWEVKQTGLRLEMKLAEKKELPMLQQLQVLEPVQVLLLVLGHLLVLVHLNSKLDFDLLAMQ